MEWKHVGKKSVDWRWSVDGVKGSTGFPAKVSLGGGASQSGAEFLRWKARWDYLKSVSSLAQQKF